MLNFINILMKKETALWDVQRNHTKLIVKSWCDTSDRHRLFHILHFQLLFDFYIFLLYWPQQTIIFLLLSEHMHCELLNSCLPQYNCVKLCLRAGSSTTGFVWAEGTCAGADGKEFISNKIIVSSSDINRKKAFRPCDGIEIENTIGFCRILLFLLGYLLHIF